MIRRVRSLEALALVVVLWISGRATYVFWPTHSQHAHVFRGLSENARPTISARSERIPEPSFASQDIAIVRPSGDRTLVALVQPQMSPPSGRAKPLPGISSASTSMAALAAENLATQSVPIEQNVDRSSMRDRQLLGSVWAFWRPNGQVTPLINPGQLGGSQFGLRAILSPGPSRRMRLSLRASAPASELSLYEIAPGASLKPFESADVELIVEHRVRGGSKDAPAMFIAGGVSASPVTGTWKLDAYAQGGTVMLKRPVWFADGSATVRHPVARGISIGAGAWGGIQPGLKRLDVGPSFSIGPEPALSNIRLTVDWRARIVGNARPTSGVALTLAKDF